jgi:branched-chain amino acid transport system permease protein
MDILLQAAAQGLLMGAAYGLTALGLGLIYSVSGVVNFAHGDFLSLAMYVSFSLFTLIGADPYMALFVTVPLLAAIGAALYFCIIRRLVDGHMLMVIQLTLGLGLMLQNGILMGYGGQQVRVPSVLDTQLLFVGDLVLRVPLIVAFAASLALSAGLAVMLQYSDFGRSIRAVHQNARAAALMGVRVVRVRMYVFALGLGVLAVAAALLLPGTPMEPTMGLRYTITTLLVLVLGGMSNFAGILVGGIVIGLSESIGTIYLSGTLGMMLPYLIFVLVLLFRPAGILGRA